MIIVTGGAGFIGSNLVHGLNAAGVTDIVIVDNLTRGEKHLNLNPLRFADYIAKEDFFEAAASLKNVEAVFHQGACSSTTEQNGAYMMKNNYEYSKRMLAFCEERKARLIYASSAAVYGGGNAGFREEEACEYPLNVYGFSKLAFDNYVRRHLPGAKIPIVGLRYFNVYGPQERHKQRMASVAMHLFDQLAANQPMRLFEGSAEFLRDFVHVDDVVKVNLFFLGQNRSGIFNCGSGQARSFVDIAQHLRTLRGSGELSYMPFPEDLANKYQRFTQADLTRLRAAGCDHAFVSLEQGVGSYYRVLDRSGGYLRHA
ncbi:MAG TPA: ADP-glyceromanno-heptose 6-epimerase [Polyangiales bacterium]|nr:ADP-glyceromanno-heptose 6-epimerase [Polyangiales bacterium]